jgi:hypothetical protein
MRRDARHFTTSCTAISPGLLDDNILLIVAIPALLIAFAVWAYRAWDGASDQPHARAAGATKAG